MSKEIFVSRRWCHLVQAVLVLTLLGGASASADTIAAGLDDFVSQRTGACYDFSGTPIPGGFFGPGSDPFTGNVPLRGEPLGGPLGATDTIVRRLTDGLMGPPPTGVTVPIEIVALNLVSVNPITITYNGGNTPQQWDLRVVDNHTVTGQMNVNHDTPGGGTFSSFFDVFVDVELTPVGGGPTHVLPRENILTQPSTTWSHAIPDGVLPSANNFFPGGVPNDPTQLNDVLFLGSGLNLDLRLTTIPEPGTLSLLSIAASTLLLRRRRR